ncbi:MAG: DHHA1 domain-containing protein [Candidatus Methanomethylicaceae archaeon]
MNVRYTLYIPSELFNLEAETWGAVLDPFTRQFLLRRLGKQEASEWLKNTPSIATPWPEIWGKGLFQEARNRVVHIFGDYDADGLTSAALLYHALKPVATSIVTHFHSREEGYGPKLDSVQTVFRQHREALILILDSGTHILAELDKIRKQGGKVFIIDHHVPKGEWLQTEYLLGLTDWVLNPHLSPRSVKAALSGMPTSALAFWATSTYAAPELLYTRALLASIGIAGDVGSARNIANHSLLRLAMQPVPSGQLPPFWIAAQKVLNLESPEPVTLSMQLVPLLNAAGRFGKTAEAYDFLVAEDVDTAVHSLFKLQWMREHVEQLNAMWQEKASQGAKDIDGNVYFYDPQIPIGILSNLSAVLLNRTQANAAIAISQTGDGAIRGSVRTKRGVNAIAFLQEVSKALGSPEFEYGGHERAAGFVARLPAEQLLVAIEAAAQSRAESASSSSEMGGGKENVSSGGPGVEPPASSDAEATDTEVTRTWHVDAVLTEKEWRLIHKADYMAMGPFVPNDDTWSFPRVVLSGVHGWEIVNNEVRWWGEQRVKFSAITKGKNFYISQTAQETDPANRAILLIATPGPKYAMGVFDLKNDLVNVESYVPKSLDFEKEERRYNSYSI